MRGVSGGVAVRRPAAVRPGQGRQLRVAAVLRRAGGRDALRIHRGVPLDERHGRRRLPHVRSHESGDSAVRIRYNTSESKFFP